VNTDSVCGPSKECVNQARIKVQVVSHHVALHICAISFNMGFNIQIDALLSFSPVHLVYCMETTPSNEAWSSMAINIEATGN
jgi:hypothetical protein